MRSILSVVGALLVTIGRNNVSLADEVKWLDADMLFDCSKTLALPANAVGVSSEHNRRGNGENADDVSDWQPRSGAATDWPIALGTHED